jgi:hypothetical protein
VISSAGDAEEREGLDRRTALDSLSASTMVGALDPPIQLGPVAQIGLALVIVLLLGLLAVLLVRSNRRRAAADDELVTAVERCFTELSRRRGLTLERVDPYPHPVLGEVRMPPRVTGTFDGFRIALAIDGDATLDGDEMTVLRLVARTGAPDWSSQADLCRKPASVPVTARASLERLCDASNRVELNRGVLVVEPKLPSTTDWHGRTRRIETDVERLDAWFELVLAFARSLS